MSVPQIANNYTVASGTSNNSVGVPVYSTVDPTSSNTKYPLGKRWINTASNNAWVLTSFSTSSGILQANWTSSGGGGLEVSTLTGGTGGAISPSSGNINLAGTANQITTTGSGSTITWSLPSALTAPGSITAASGAITATNGNLVLGTAGNKIVSSNVGTTTAAGANSFGSVTLVAGTATVATTAVTANSLIVLWRQSVGATGANPVGVLSVGAIVAGTSFVIGSVQPATANAFQTTDVSVVGWMIIN